MAWPTADEFVAAALSGADAFEDPELREAAPARDPHGAPIVARGRAAVVVGLDVEGRRVALRLWLRERSDRVKRYARLAEYLARHDVKAFVPFELLERGVRVGDRWYPALKMAWVEGETLDARVRRLLDDPSALRALADDFFAMMGELARHNVAHGDLQPDNILVTPRGLRLIDYDTTYAAGLETVGAAEPGAADYQHPRRARQDFSPSLDHFSAWILHLSLLALSIDPSLYARFGEGDRLLFRREDFEQAETAPVVAALRALPHGDVLAERFLDALRWDPLTVPPLEDLRLPPPAPLPAQPFVPSPAMPEGPAAPAPAPPPAPRAAPRAEAERGEPTRGFAGTLRLERASLGVLAAALALLGLFAFARATPLLVVALLALAQVLAWAGYLVVAHGTHAAVRERREALRRVRRAQEELADAERRMGALPPKPIVTSASGAEARLAELAREEEAELAAIEREAAHALEAIHARRLAGAEEADALDAQEAQVVDEARSREEGVRLRYRGERARVQADIEAVATAGVRAKQELDQQRAALAAELDEKRRALAWAQEEVRAYEDVAFPRFVARVLGRSGA